MSTAKGTPRGDQIEAEATARKEQLAARFAAAEARAEAARAEAVSKAVAMSAPKSEAVRAAAAAEAAAKKVTFVAPSSRLFSLFKSKLHHPLYKVAMDSRFAEVEARAAKTLAAKTAKAAAMGASKLEQRNEAEIAEVSFNTY